MYEKIFVCLMLFSLVSGEVNSEDKRKGRFLSFNSVDDDLKIDLDFTIPFLSIPVKKMMNTFGGSVGFPPINVNTASLVLAGILIIGSTTILPLILKKKASYYDHRLSRVLEASELGDETLIGVVNELLKESQVWSGCPQKLACWAGRKIYHEDPMKIWNPILSNSILSSFVNASSIEEAISTGRKGSTCDKYSPCKLNQDNFSIIWQNLAVLTNV